MGGWIAGITSGIRGSGVGLLNGFLTWSLATVLTLALATFGPGPILGSVGQFINLGSSFNLQNIDPTQLAGLVRNAAFWATLSLVGGALAATIDGWLGVKMGPIGYAMPAERTH